MPRNEDSDSLKAYLCVDRFIRTIVDARALKTAFELKLIDQLHASSLDVARIQQAMQTDSAGAKLMIGLLKANRVIEPAGTGYSLTPDFRKAIEFRDLLLAKTDFANLVAPDFVELFTALIAEPRRFMREARLFKLFDYSKCFQSTPENLSATRRWMRFTTALTRYEAPIIMHHHDFARHARILDVGGNSGELAAQVCQRFSHAQATVFDLPVVCEIGRAHVAEKSAAVSFVAGNAMSDPFPGGFDLVIFKSMLHDWPDDHARQLLAKAHQSLKPGGTVLIFERGQFEVGENGWPYWNIPMLLFFRSFRQSRFYEDALRSLGYPDVTSRRIDLELPFFLVTARKPE